MRDQFNIVYLSLGSNQGARWELLQTAVFMLDFCLGEVRLCSSVYETPSWGFDGADFLNACVCVRTEKSVEQTLACLLSIEKTLGRTRFSKEGYQNRTLDLDILLFNNQIIDTPDIKVPHPQMHRRKFVLVPLSEIAAEELHPVYQKTIAEILQCCPDVQLPQRYEKGLSKPEKTLSDYDYIAVEGNIGSGKTTLSTMISKQYNAKLILERYADNPFLPKFYEEPDRYGFALEMSFLADRYTQANEEFNQLDLFKNFTVSDYNVFKSLIFAAVTLTAEEYQLYRKLFYIMYANVVKPDLYVFLYQNTERLLKNIAKRGRSYEKSIEAAYLDAINRGYLDFIQSHPDLNVLLIDVSERDFVENPYDYYFILAQIKLRNLMGCM